MNSNRILEGTIKQLSLKIRNQEQKGYKKTFVIANETIGKIILGCIW
jgi:hypothetical protein